MQPQAKTASDLDIPIQDELNHPTDTVSTISWAPSGNNPTFATSDWASYIRIYNLDPEASTLTQQACFDAQSPCLNVQWHEDETTLFAGCTDGSVKSFDVASGHYSDIGKHEGPVKSVHWISASNSLLTLSFDKTLRFWDPRQAQNVAGFRLDHKVYCSDVLYPYLAIGLSEAKCLFVDLPNIEAALGGQNGGRINYLDSELGKTTQITSIKLYKGERTGFGISGNDGRCHVSHFRQGDQIFEKFDSVITFKAHKDFENQKQVLYPMNCFGLHPQRGSQFLCTGGGNGKMRFWDIKQRNEIAEFDFKGMPVTQTEIDPTGKYLAYSLGYDWARGIQGYMTQPTKIFVHALKERELDRDFDRTQNYPLKYP